MQNYVFFCKWPKIFFGAHFFLCFCVNEIKRNAGETPAHPKMRRRYILTFFMMLIVSFPGLQAQWKGSLSAGVAFPAGATGNAPRLSTSFTAGIRAVWIPERMPLGLTAMLDGFHWLKGEHPDRSAVPLDEELHTFRALHFPLTVGLWIPFVSLHNTLNASAYIAVGGYWRNMTCQRMAAPGVMDDMEESGWGVAWKVGIEIIYNDRFSLGISYLACGNPFATGGDPLPAGTGMIENGIRRSQPSLDGYGQGFLCVTLGYWLTR